jgi:predicted metal-dependent enzyme (double-stranded beta helix superfamily)
MALALEPFLDGLEEQAGDRDAPLRVKDYLSRALKEGIDLPERFARSSPDRYARHLLARLEGGVTAVVMVWSRGQGTPVHDHAGMWCVEGVIRGSIRVNRYEVVGRQGDRMRFRQTEVLTAGVGNAGALIPPVDHHVIANDHEETALTLHVYEGEMTTCSVFLPVQGDLYRCESRSLSYTTSDPVRG